MTHTLVFMAGLLLGALLMLAGLVSLAERYEKGRRPKPPKDPSVTGGAYGLRE